MKKEMIMLTDLNCPTCAADVEKAFKKAKGVKEASVNFGTGALNLEYDPEVLEDKTIKKILTGHGLGIASRL